ncbi:hypothetical protein T552_00044 [Pneumocystis carinii B80]|uniref:Uncharacterized protein n=1 Tax=Pneumocystis carinii (strain B80) TaxID=1408658 RepID=A0A0W4ZSP6_PNEC8|nr:hypothetical protein T552_00044 [Pneumocystis carinii B80]KTW31399.1 hypothetical protein T552_00044 [Pneumocystis carinii B80]
MNENIFIQEQVQRSDSYDSFNSRGFFNLSSNQILKEDGSSSISEIFVKQKSYTFFPLNGIKEGSSALFSIYSSLLEEPETPKVFYKEKKGKKSCKLSQIIKRFLMFLVKMTCLYVWGHVVSILIFHIQTKENNTTPYKFEIISHIPYFRILYGIGMVFFGLLTPVVEFLMYKFGFTKTLKKACYIEIPRSKYIEIFEIIRIFSTFMGIVCAFAKLSWALDVKASLFLFFIGFSMWFIFDRAQTGFFLSSIMSILFTIIISFTSDIFKNEDLMGKEVFGIRSWILGFFFSSCIAAGNIGRRLFRSI